MYLSQLQFRNLKKSHSFRVYNKPALILVMYGHRRNHSRHLKVAVQNLSLLQNLLPLLLRPEDGTLSLLCNCPLFQITPLRSSSLPNPSEISNCLILPLETPRLPMASLPPPSTVDPHIWKSCAGTSTQIPTIGSCVYYFPEGHAEQCYSPPDFSSLSVRPLALFRCRVVDVDFLADHSTDEVFSRIRLKPEAGLTVAAAACSSVSTDSSSDGGGGPPVVFFAKILTPSDANNGGGFSVPRFCADQIFPPLDYDADPPVQTITVRDVHGTAYDFRHIYRGTPRRHLLTTGWSKFVNQKKLVAGDSVVFIRNRGKELFVGVRRAARGDCGRWTKVEESGVFSRSGRGKVSPEAVVEAAGLAGSGMIFEVVYYPRMGSPNFVVPAEAVEDALSMYWAAGLRVKMAVETEDSSRMTWFQGTVTAMASQELSHCSPWRMLQVCQSLYFICHSVDILRAGSCN
ncbi:Arf17p [Asimina triloba]